MIYNNTVVKKYLEFIPNEESISSLYGNVIWSYQQFIDIINKCLFDVFTEIKATTASPVTEAPFMTYNATTKLITLNIEQLYSNTTQLWLNNYLYITMPSFQKYSANNLNISMLGIWNRLFCKDNLNNSSIINGKPYFSTKQEFVTMYRLNDFKSIVFETNSIPVSSEYIMTQKNISETILADFEISEGYYDNYQVVQFTPSGDIRWYDLESALELRTIKLKVFWTTRNGTIYPLFIDNDLFTLKIYIRKKIY